MKATYLSSKHFRNGSGADVLQHVFRLDGTIGGYDSLTISTTNDDRIGYRTIVYAGGTADWKAPKILQERDMVSASYALDLCFISYDPIPKLQHIERKPHLRDRYTWRVGDILIATRDAADLGLSEGACVNVVEIRHFGGWDRTVMRLVTDDERSIECSVRHPGLRPARFRWTVEIEIDARWVADGIDLTSAQLQHMLEHAYPYLRSTEVRGTTIEAPDPEDVAREQGYRSAADRIARARK